MQLHSAAAWFRSQESPPTTRESSKFCLTGGCYCWVPDQEAGRRLQEAARLLEVEGRGGRLAALLRALVARRCRMAAALGHAYALGPRTGERLPGALCSVLSLQHSQEASSARRGCRMAGAPGHAQVRGSSAAQCSVL
jgi:hypothetical protein